MSIIFNVSFIPFQNIKSEIELKLIKNIGKIVF